MGGQPASPRGRSSPCSVESSVQGPGSRALVRSRTRSPTRATTGVLSPGKVVTKHAGTSSGGAHVTQVAALQMVQQDLSTYSPEYSPASPSPSRHCVSRAKVGRGKVLTPPLDRTGTDLPPSSVRRHIRPPPIRRPIEVHACTDSDDDDEEEEEPNDVTSLREQLAALRLCLNNMDECIAETEIDRTELGDRVETLRKAVCSKIKRLAKATGNEDLYRSSDPK